MDDFIEVGKKHLPSYRAHFEKLTQSVVEHHVANRLFKDDEKRFAALAWLNELREKQRATETWRFRWTLIVAAATLAVAGLGTYFAYNALPVTSPAAPAPVSSGKSPQ